MWYHLWIFLSISFAQIESQEVDLSVLKEFQILEFSEFSTDQKVDTAAVPQGHDKFFRVGDRLLLKIKSPDELVGNVNLKSDSLKFEPPPGSKTLFELGWVLSFVPADIPGGQGHLQLLATIIKPGELSLPVMLVKDSQGNLLGKTSPLTIQSISAIDKKDPKPQESVPVRPPVAIAFPIGVAIVSALVFLGLAFLMTYFLWKFTRRNQTPTVLPAIEKPEKAEDLEALEALLALEREGLLKKGQFKPYYFKSSEILKYYLGRRYRFDAVESTTYEMLCWLESQQTLTEQNLKNLEEMFRTLDRVKFTDHVPDLEEPQRLLESARGFINNTSRKRLEPGVENATR